MVDAAFRKSRTIKSCAAALALFSVVFAGRFGVESMHSLQVLRAGGLHRSSGEAAKPQKSTHFNTAPLDPDSAPSFRPKYVRCASADMPLPAVFGRNPLGRIFDSEDPPAFFHSHTLRLQSPRAPPAIS